MNSKALAKDIYKRITHKKTIIILALSIGILLSLIINVFVGSAGLSFSETVNSIFRLSKDTNQIIIWEFRMPVALAAIFIGVALGVGGCEMQTVLGNPMASPFTLGISSAASFGAALAIIMKISVIPGFGSMLISLNAFIFTLIASSIIFIFSRKFNSNREMLILFGIALNFLFGSLTTLLQYVADENDLQTLVFWSFGNLNKIGWGKLGIIALVTIVIFIKFARDSWSLTAMTLGDTNAKSLGIDVNKMRRNTIISVALLSAVAVSFAGTIGFVGLVAPHMARLISGEDQRYFLPISALMGGLILSVASIFSKIIVPGTILPIGLVTSLLGIPFFTYLIMKKKGGYI